MANPFPLLLSFPTKRFFELLHMPNESFCKLLDSHFSVTYKSLSCVAGWSSIQVVDGQSDCELWSLPPLVLSQSWRCSAVHLPHQPPADESSGSYSSLINLSHPQLNPPVKEKQKCLWDTSTVLEVFSSPQCQTYKRIHELTITNNYCIIRKQLNKGRRVFTLI